LRGIKTVKTERVKKIIPQVQQVFLSW